jgi:YVTN family beta-propeller protein
VALCCRSPKRNLCHIAFHSGGDYPAGNEAYVSNEGEASISIVNLESLKVVGTIHTEDMPHNVRFSGDGKTAYVTLQGGAGLGVIDTQARKVIRVIPVPGLTGPHNLDLSRDGRMAFVRDTANHVAVVDLDTGEVRRNFDASTNVLDILHLVVSGAINSMQAWWRSWMIDGIKLSTVNGRDATERDSALVQTSA